MSDWPYPFWIAHRGGGRLAPENTLAAFHRGYAAGWRMFECDVQLSADGLPFLLHDLRLERTTNGQGLAHQRPWAALAQLDAGRHHGPAYAGEPPATLEQVAAFCLQRRCAINVEIKPPPASGRAVGETVAGQVSRLWRPSTALPPLLSSFDAEAVAAARAAAPALPRAWILDRLHDGWLQRAQDLQCVAVVGDYLLWDEDSVCAAAAVGMRTLSYTVNDRQEAVRLRQLGTVGVVTDDLLPPMA